MRALFKSKKMLWAVLIVFSLAAVLAVCLYDRAVLDSLADVDVDDLWPENGPVIATIGGREYRYDPVYLYRLTGCVFADDPYAVVESDIDVGWLTEGTLESLDPTPKDQHIGAPTAHILSRDTFWIHSDSCVENPVVTPGLTMAENAVRFEIEYLDQIGKPIEKHVQPNLIKEGRERTMNGAAEYFRKKYRGLNEEDAQKQALQDLGPGDDFGYNDADLAYCVMMNKAKFKEGQTVSRYLRQVTPYIEKHAMIASYSFPDYFSDDYISSSRDITFLMKKYNVEMVY